MSKFSDVLEQLRDNQPTANHGIAFERLMVHRFRANPILSATYGQVVRWKDWEYNDDKADTGIDLVARRSEDGLWTAI